MILFGRSRSQVPQTLLRPEKDPRFAGKRKEKITGKRKEAFLAIPLPFLPVKRLETAYRGRRRKKLRTSKGRFARKSFSFAAPVICCSLAGRVDVAGSRLLTQRSATGWKTQLDRKTPSIPKRPQGLGAGKRKLKHSMRAASEQNDRGRDRPPQAVLTEQLKQTGTEGRLVHGESRLENSCAKAHARGAPYL